MVIAGIFLGIGVLDDNFVKMRLLCIVICLVCMILGHADTVLSTLLKGGEPSIVSCSSHISTTKKKSGVGESASGKGTYMQKDASRKRWNRTQLHEAGWLDHSPCRACNSTIIRPLGPCSLCIPLD